MRKIGLRSHCFVTACLLRSWSTLFNHTKLMLRPCHVEEDHTMLLAVSVGVLTPIPLSSDSTTLQIFLSEPGTATAQ